jgi:hypothetical protein
VVFFKHQHITNPDVSSETMVIQTSQQQTSTLQGNIAPETKAAKALRRVSTLFTKIGTAKASAAKAKEQQNQIRTHPEARQATPLPRVAEQNSRVKISLPRVTKVPEADCCTVQIAASPPVPRQGEQAPATRSQSRSPWATM